MFAKLCAKRNKKGFTLAELLIVIAIIAVLVAIAIPVYTTQLKKAEDAVKQANERSASFMAVADYALDEVKQSTYIYAVDEKYNMEQVDSAPASGSYVTVTIDTKTGKVTDSVYTK